MSLIPIVSFSDQFLFWNLRVRFFIIKELVNIFRGYIGHKLNKCGRKGGLRRFTVI